MGLNRDASATLTHALAAVLVFAVGVATRFAPRHWTPLPFNPDGFRFARQAEHAARSGELALNNIAPQGYGFPVLLSHLQLVTGVDALTLSQPAIAIIGTIPCLFAFAFAHRIAVTLNWSPTQQLVVATTAGLVLAMEGAYLRRSAAVSYEVLGILFVVVSAFAFHQWLASEQRRWVLVLVCVLLVLPVTHHLSTMIAALVLTGLAVLHVHQSVHIGTLGRSVSIAALFWVYFAMYYLWTQPPYFGELVAKPGLFLAWVIALGGLAVFFRTTSVRLRRVLFGLPFLVGLVLFAINAVVPVFPGAAETHPRFLFHMAPLTVLVLVAAWGAPLGIDSDAIGPVVLALFLGPLAFVFFGLTAGLSPVYRDFAARGQTFSHLSLVVMGALAVGELGWRYTGRDRLQATLKTTLPTILVVCALISLPMAFLGLPAVPYDPTTTTSQFQSVTFAESHVEANWTSDDHLTRVGNEYYNASVSPGPTYEWLQSSRQPTCPVVVRDSWSSVGAQAYPGDPIPVDGDRTRRFIDRHTTVYRGGPGPAQSIVVPDTDPGQCS